MTYRNLAFTLLLVLSGETIAEEPVSAPDTAVKFLEVSAEGVQIYICTAKENSFSWVFQGPEADLFDAPKHKIGAHGAGPIWKLNDGSAVVGEKVSETGSPEPQAISWLLLRVKSHSGAGQLATAAWIRRVDTHGGAAPTNGCDTAHAGVTTRVPYSATYQFFR
ncbi:MAG: DUF3455 domain-containing protein [Methylomonas sp.]|jgi:hypothetical protein